jgi:YggT family protein
MFVLANFITAAAHILNILLTIIYWLVIIRAVISWVNPDPDNTLVQLLYKTTEPILEPIRRRMPINFRFGLDISPVIVILVIIFLQSFLIRSLYDLSARLSLK